ncbi:MAG: hypothetical protein ABSE62_07720 [Chthoniobacteraceae bacterium]|jgi:hypothetical protein
MAARPVISYSSRLLAVVMVVAFVHYGARGIRKSYSRRTDGQGDFSSTDAFLLQALQVHGAARQILAATSDLPPLEPLAVIAPNDDVFGPILQPTISSITWPREIQLVQTSEQDSAKTIDVLRDHHFAAALFYNIPAPAGRRVGLLTIVPIRQ